MPLLNIPNMRIGIFEAVFHILIHVFGLLLPGEKIRHTLLIVHLSILLIFFIFFFLKLLILNYYQMYNPRGEG